MRAMHLTLPAAAMMLAVVAGSAAAQGTLPRLKEEKPGMVARAHITPDSATRMARAAVPGGHVAAREMEEEDGKLIYSFDMKVAGKSGIEEVNIDAMTGAMIGIEHESPAAEAKEGRADSLARRKAAARREKAEKGEANEKDDRD